MLLGAVCPSDYELGRWVKYKKSFPVADPYAVAVVRHSQSQGDGVLWPSFGPAFEGAYGQGMKEQPGQVAYGRAISPPSIPRMQLICP